MSSSLVRAVVALFALGLTCCDSTETDVGEVNSNSNWLQVCDADAECGSEGACTCGICSVPCDVSTDCGDERPGAVCSAPDATAVEALCDANPVPQRGVCLPECVSDEDCGRGELACFDGACIPAEVTTGVTTGDTTTTSNQTSGENNGTTTGETGVSNGTTSNQTSGETTVCAEGVQSCQSGSLTLFVCRGGALVEEEACQFACVALDNERAECANQACPDGSGLYCGSDLGLTEGFLYACRDEGAVTVAEECTAGCTSGTTAGDASCSQ